jgi:hypothetical protein
MRSNQARERNAFLAIGMNAKRRKILPTSIVQHDEIEVSSISSGTSHDDRCIDDHSNVNELPNISSNISPYPSESECSSLSSDDVDPAVDQYVRDHGLERMVITKNSRTGLYKVDFDETLALGERRRSNLPCFPDSDLSPCESALAHFIKRNIPKFLHPFGMEHLPDPLIFQFLDEFAKGTMNQSSMERIMKFSYSAARVGWEQRDQELLQQIELVKVTHPHYDLSGLTKFIGDRIEKEKGWRARQNTTERIRLSLLDRGLAVPFLEYKICKEKHMWPSKSGIYVPQGICCQTNEKFCYSPKILHIMQQFRTKFLSECMDKQLEKCQQEADDEEITDWTSGSVFKDIFAPFMTAALARTEIPIAVAANIDGADLCTWANKSQTPMININLMLPKNIRCNLGMIMPLGMIPDIVSKHRRQFHRLDIFESNIAFRFGFPAYSAHRRKLIYCRLLYYYFVFDYPENVLTSYSSQGGHRDACGWCNVVGETNNNLTLWPGLWRYLPKTHPVFKKCRKAWRTDQKRLSVANRKLEKDFLAESMPKSDAEMRRRLQSSRSEDLGGLRSPVEDLYSLDLLCPFDHVNQMAHDMMHAVNLCTFRRLADAIDHHHPKRDTSSHIKPEQAYGRNPNLTRVEQPDLPHWRGIDDDREGPFKKTEKNSTLSLVLRDFIKRCVVWATGNDQKITDCFVRSFWKAHDSAQYMNDAGMAIMHAISLPIFSNSQVYCAKQRLFWCTFIEFLGLCNRMFAKSIARSNLSVLALEWRANLASLELLGPQWLCTISFHLLVHFPDCISRFGPMAGFQWVYPAEHFISYMKQTITSSIGQSLNSMKSLQLIQAGVIHRVDHHKQYEFAPECPMTHGASDHSNMQPNSEDVEIIKLSRRDENRPFQLLSPLERSWLHHHINNNMFPSLDDAEPGQWRKDYVKLVSRYEAEHKTDVSNQFRFHQQLNKFTDWMSKINNEDRRDLPDRMETFDRAMIGRCMFRSAQADAAFGSTSSNRRFIIQQRNQDNNDKVESLSGTIKYISSIYFNLKGLPAFSIDLIRIDCVQEVYQHKVAIYKKIKMPGYVKGAPFEAGKTDTVWADLTDIAPCNIIHIPSKLTFDNRVSATNIFWVCLLPRTNMHSTIPISTFIDEV